MKNEALKRVQNAKRELELAEKALTNKLPIYVEVTNSSSWHTNYVGRIFKVTDELGIRGGVIVSYNNSTRGLLLSDFKPSTKEAYEAQNDIIRVPECIKFNGIGQIGIVFNNDKQSLFYSHEYETYHVASTYCITNGSHFKLTKCERSDLKAGDVAYYGLPTSCVKNDLAYYGVILSDRCHVCIEGNINISVEGSTYYDHWYKVEKI